MKTAPPDRNPDRAKLFTYLIAVYIIWGSTYLAMRIGTEVLPPFLLASLRFIVAGGILLVIGQLREKQWPNIRQLLSASFVGVLLIGIGNGSVAVAVHQMPSGLVALIVAAIPAWFIGLDWAFFSKKAPSALTIAGITVGFAGLFLLFNPFSQTGARDYPLWPVGLVIGGCICWALGSLLVQRLPMPTQITSTAIQMLAGCVFSMLASVLLEREQWNMVSQMNIRTWSSLIYLIVMGSLVGFTSYSWLTRNAPPRLTATYAYVNPVVALFLGWAIAGESLSTMAGVASAVVIGGVVLMTLGRNK